MAKKTKKPARAAAPPCGCGIDSSQCTGVLVARLNGEPIDPTLQDADRWICSVNGGPGCGFYADARDADGRLVRCGDCGGPLRFDDTIVGTTCGGLKLRGWDKCDNCGSIWVTRRGVPDSGGGSDGRWRLAAGGRSLDAGGMRVRAEGKGGDVPQLMARLSRMPAFEAALERIANGDLDAAAATQISRDALAIGDGVDEVEA